MLRRRADGYRRRREAGTGVEEVSDEGPPPVVGRQRARVGRASAPADDQADDPGGEVPGAMFCPTGRRAGTWGRCAR
jgi:hypothetical protein